MKKQILSAGILVIGALTAAAQQTPEFKVIVDTSKEPVHEGVYQPTVESLSDYVCPEWFRDAKFGIWAHWGPQCQPENGDWYGRQMYIQGNSCYRYNIDTKGHPSEFGMKDWINEWKADEWDPEELVKFYKESGAKYFLVMANHHDNFDMYDSKYQPWNSVNMGPKKDIIAAWAQACLKYDIPMGVSVHAAHAWTWYETSRGSDRKGPLAGVPYDGWVTREDGVGKWWEGYDPQDLYEQRHPLSKDSGEWDWDENKVTTPDQQYCDRIYNRTVQLVNDYNPAFVYFDDTYLPLWPVSDVGLKLLAHIYNKSMAENGGRNEAVVTGKVLKDWQKETLVWDVERGAPSQMQSLPWQTCTCIGQWHYDKHLYYNDLYKSAAQVIGMLVDIVSKNGNLMLNIPVRGNGTIDPTERRIVSEIGHWLSINGESIYGTRPWVIYGEGPSTEEKPSEKKVGFNEGGDSKTAEDIRFNTKGKNTLYVTTLGVPQKDVTVRSLGSKTQYNSRKIKSIRVLGSSEQISWTQSKDSLTIVKPAEIPTTEAVVFCVTFK